MGNGEQIVHVVIILQDGVIYKLFMKNVEINTYWDWHEFGFCFKFSRLKNHPDYWWQIDIHFLFFDMWINFISKI